MNISDVFLLTANALFLFFLLTIYSFVKKNYVHKYYKLNTNSAIYQVVNGFVLGSICILIMTLPFVLTLAHGFIFDARFILLATVAFLFHVRTTIVCIIMICSCRILIGGDFNVVLAIFIASASIAVVGFCWRPYFKSTTRVFFHDLLFYGFMTQAVHLALVFFFVPFPLFKHILLSFLFIYPVLIALMIYYLNYLGEHPISLLESIENSYLFNVQYNSKSIGFSISSPEKEMVKVNPRLCQLLGYSESEFKKLTWTQYTHPDDQAISIKLFEQLLSGEIDHYNLKKRLITKDGDIIYIQLNVYGIRNELNKVEVLVTTYIDLSNSRSVSADAQAYEHL